jgi:hypothetical protein
VLDIHHYSLLYTPCWLSKPSACVRVENTSERDSFFTILPLPSPEKVRVASCSLEVFWFCYSVLKSLEKNKKNTAKIKKKQKKKEAKKQEDIIEGALCVFSFLLCGGAL